MQRFKNKICLVTGATSGTGRAVAVQLGREGGCVVLLDRDIAHGREVVREVQAAGGQALLIRTDVGRDASLVVAVRKIRAAWGRQDVVVSNAAMMTFEPLLQLDPKQWDHLMNLNVRALMPTDALPA